MNIPYVTLDNKDYIILERVNVKDKKYYILGNEEDNKDICIRKIIEENNEEYLVGLEDEKEFNLVLDSFLNKKKEFAPTFYPIGSIVNLQHASKKVMITGYLMRSKNGIIYDYCGCEYPEGLTSNNDMLYFDVKNIVALIKMGCMDEEVKKVLDKVQIAKKTLKF